MRINTLEGLGDESRAVQPRIVRLDADRRREGYRGSFAMAALQRQLCKVSCTFFTELL
jgi:hypothetical protein